MPYCRSITEHFGLSLAMVGVLLSLNRWIRLIANSGVAAISASASARMR